MTKAKATTPGRKAGVFGTVHQLPSGNFRAMYYGPDGLRHTGPTTFQTKGDARGWLAVQQADVIREKWAAPSKARVVVVTLGEFADTWLAQRTLKPRTAAHYRSLLDAKVLPGLGGLAVGSVTPAVVRRWHGELGTATPTARAHAYGLLRTIMASAVADGLILMNPCSITGAGSAKRVHKVRPATLPEIAALTAAMPVHLRAMTLLAAWCGLRFGELTELRRADVDTTVGVLRIRRAVVRAGGVVIVGTPKSDAGVRDVAIPPHLLPLVEAHLVEHTQPGAKGLLFPAQHGGHLAPSALYRPFYAARELAGRPDLRWHDLRHTGAVLAASTGATLAELMGRLGHSTPAAALRYQHTAAGRDQQIAAALSALAGHQEQTPAP